VVSGSYSIYVDGRPTGRTLDVKAANASATLDFADAVVETTLDGQDTDIGRVTLRQGGISRFTLAYDAGTGTHSLHVLLSEDGEPSEPDADVFEVFVDGSDSGFTLDASDSGREPVVIPYYSATVDIVYDAAWTNASVTLRQDGATTSYLPFLASAAGPGSDFTSTYVKAMRGDTGSDSYAVFVNGANTGESLTLKQSGGKTEAEVEYYRATIEVSLDGSPWKNAGVELWRGEKRAYIAPFDEAIQAHSYPYVQLLGTDALDVRISGSISGADTGIVLSEAAPLGGADYYSISYVDLGSAYLTQVVKSGEKATRPATPYHPGYTFKGWSEVANSDNWYDFTTAVSAKTTLYAVYDAPSVVIGGYVRCDAGGVIQGTGGYYRMVNLAIMGYPSTGAPIKTATLHATNAAVSDIGSRGYTIFNNIDTQTHDGFVTISFGVGGSGGVSMAEAQRFLREDIVVEVVDTSIVHTMQVDVYGATYNGSGQSG
jgi:hypothetical protein